MLFEIFNDKGHRVFMTNSENCLPEKEHINSMIANGYKVKLDSKTLTKKATLELYSKTSKKG